MKTSRLESFSDGVIAVILTIMVLELKAPKESSWAAIQLILPGVLIYGFSFLIIAIMWVNHHHYMHAAKRADAALMWANNNLLFWMSLIPFVTGYLGQHYQDAPAVAAYGAVLSVTSFGFLLFQWAIARQNGESEEGIGHFCRIRMKAMASVALYAASVGLAFIDFRASYAIFALVAAAYFLPDRMLAE
jgi:uncharacterized membrane protein